MERLEKVRLQRDESLTNLICFYGLWQSASQVDEGLEILPNDAEKKSSGILTEISKTVLKQKHAIKGLFYFSRKLPTGKYEKFTLTELKDIKTLVHCTLATPTHEIASEGIPLLVNKKIEHKFSDGVVYKGNVISVVPGFPHWYNVKYENDSAVYAYNLFEDYKNGDLKIIIDS